MKCGSKRYGVDELELSPLDEALDGDRNIDNSETKPEEARARGDKAEECGVEAAPATGDEVRICSRGNPYAIKQCIFVIDAVVCACNLYSRKPQHSSVAHRRQERLIF